MARYQRKEPHAACPFCEAKISRTHSLDPKRGRASFGQPMLYFCRMLEG